MFDKKRICDIINFLFMAQFKKYALILVVLSFSITLSFSAFSEDDTAALNPDPGFRMDTKETEPSKKTSDEVYILKKADIARIGAQASYEEFAGKRFAKYFSVGQRVEIFQEARPVDAYILDAKAIRILGQGGSTLAWDQPVNFRQQIVNQFTRAYGTQITLDNPNDPGAQIRYTIDYRDIYKQFYPKFSEIKVERWLQNELMFIYANQIPGINWYITTNLGYRYSNIEVKGSEAGYENRHTYIASLGLAPNEQFEWYGQFEYFKSKRPSSPFVYSPDHWYYRTEFRFKTDDLKTSLIPFFSYSADKFFPFKNTFEKYEMGARLGRDFNDKFSATTQLSYVLGLRTEKDNTAPTYGAPNPYKDSASAISWENRASYKAWKDFYLQGGVDLAAGTNMSDFDNWGTLLGLEYYKPGILRANFGWNMHHYYNIDDFLNSIAFRVFIFM